MRPLLLGMNNPQGNMPLWPDPPGCTGHRIWLMIREVTGCNKRQYLRAIERQNVVDAKAYSARAARAARDLFRDRLQGRTTVLLGAAVLAALGLPRPPVGSWQALPQGRWCYIPHPSGLNRWYNDADNGRLSQQILVEIFDEGRRTLGLPLLRHRETVLES